MIHNIIKKTCNLSVQLNSYFNCYKESLFYNDKIILLPILFYKKQYILY